MAVPAPLQFLIDQLTRAIAQRTARFEEDGDAESWQRDLEHELTRYHTSAYMAGRGSPTMNDSGARYVRGQVKAQMEFLDNFRLDIQNAREWRAGFNRRAASYAEAIKKPYWKGATEILPLPAMPAEGTQCLNNCKCAWEIDVIDEEAGDYDAYWQRGATDSCQTCIEREMRWRPVRIRGGVLQL
ncbi:MAG: hypothetical protein IT323_13475 [Anaerolineae bacterium]|nr:hypothetical protein [Anaerolineae bacterium]